MPQTPTNLEAMRARAEAEAKARRATPTELSANDARLIRDFATSLGHDPEKPVQVIIRNRGRGRKIGPRTIIKEPGKPWAGDLGGNGRNGFEYCDSCEDKAGCKRAATCKATV